MNPRAAARTSIHSPYRRGTKNWFRGRVANILAPTFGAELFIFTVDCERSTRLRVDGKRRYQLWGESIREIGILLLVFGPLETLIRTRHFGKPDVLIALALAAFGFILIFIGVLMGGET